MPTPHHSSFFTGRMPFLPPNQQRQSTEGNHKLTNKAYLSVITVTSICQNFTYKMAAKTS